MNQKTVFITGATGDIGEAITLKFAQEGYALGLHYHKNEEKKEILKTKLEHLNATFYFYQGDLSQEGVGQKLLEDFITEVKQIDVLINNAGITKVSYLLKMSENDFIDVLQANLVSAWRTSKGVVKQMMKQRKGCIINMSSIIGLTGNVAQSNYSSSKSGMIGLTKSLAKELASRNIRVNAIAPGFIETQMTAKLPEEYRDKLKSEIPLGRYGQPEDIANLVLFLSSDQASYITGQVISIDGGLYS